MIVVVVRLSFFRIPTATASADNRIQTRAGGSAVSYTLYTAYTLI
jgi:hypothetical protein